MCCVVGALLQLLNMTVTYSKTFKDPFLLDPPAWFQSFIYCELLLQFPFFFVASYAFWKGTERRLYAQSVCEMQL